MAVDREAEIEEMKEVICDLRDRIEQLEDEKKYIEQRIDDQMAQNAEVREEKQHMEEMLTAQDRQMVQVIRQNEWAMNEKKRLELQVVRLRLQLNEEQQQNGELKRNMGILKEAVGITRQQESGLQRKVQLYASELNLLKETVQKQETKLYFRQKAIDTLSRQLEESARQLQQLEAYRRAKDNAESALEELETKVLETDQLLNIPVEDVRVTTVQLGRGSYGGTVRCHVACCRSLC